MFDSYKLNMGVASVNLLLCVFPVLSKIIIIYTVKNISVGLVYFLVT